MEQVIVRSLTVLSLLVAGCAASSTEEPQAPSPESQTSSGKPVEAKPLPSPELYSGETQPLPGDAHQPSWDGLDLAKCTDPRVTLDVTTGFATDTTTTPAREWYAHTVIAPAGVFPSQDALCATAKPGTHAATLAELQELAAIGAAHGCPLPSAFRLMDLWPVRVPSSECFDTKTSATRPVSECYPYVGAPPLQTFPGAPPPPATVGAVCLK